MSKPFFIDDDIERSVKEQNEIYTKDLVKIKDNIFLGYEKTSYKPIQQHTLGGYKMENKITKQEMDWLDQEIAEQQSNQTQMGERLPYLKLEPKKLADIEIDLSIPFGKWTDNVKGITKAIITLTHNKEKKVWFLNKRNPVYQEICKKLKLGQVKFKILQTGQQAETKYEIITE
jgi:hypothetical protein